MIAEVVDGLHDFIAAMLDEAMSTAAIIASNVTMNAPTLEMKISYLRPLFVGKASAEAKILKWGKSTCFIEAELFDPDGKLVANSSPGGVNLCNAETGAAVRTIAVNQGK